MVKFSEYIRQREDTIELISKELDVMDIEELEELGEYIYDEFFEYDETEDYEDDYAEDDSEYEPTTKEEILELLSLFTADDLEIVLDMIQFEEYSGDELDEGVTPVMKTSNINKKKRKYMKKSVADLRKEKVKRAQYNRKNKQNIKAYYRKNKRNIKRYQKSYNDKLKKGHTKKTRKPA